MSNVRPLSDVLSKSGQTSGPSWLTHRTPDAQALHGLAPKAPAPRVLPRSAPETAASPPPPPPAQVIDMEKIVAEANAKADARVEAVIAKYANTIETLEAARAAYLEPFHAEALALALVIARGVVRHELETSPDLILSTVKEAIRELGADDPMRVRLGSVDLEHLMENHPELFTKNIELVEDPKLSPGTCIAENTKRVVDASFSTRMEAIARNLMRDLDEA
jgi:flagellar assembly protein FliH